MQFVKLHLLLQGPIIWTDKMPVRIVGHACAMACRLVGTLMLLVRLC